ncbi:MAG: hypothetical protein FAF04_02070 [Epsilonproteobacteria bacterium]|nr:hypothetical protein [Campylobacterota bacterium]
MLTAHHLKSNQNKAQNRTELNISYKDTILITGTDEEVYTNNIHFDKASYEAIKKAVKENTKIQRASKDKEMKKSIDIKNYIKTKWSPNLIIIDQLVANPIGRVPVGRK